MVTYRCRFCRDDATRFWDLHFKKKPKMTIGTCNEHHKYVLERLLYLCEHGEVHAIGLRIHCEKCKKGEGNGSRL